MTNLEQLFDLILMCCGSKPEHSEEAHTDRSDSASLMTIINKYLSVNIYGRTVAMEMVSGWRKLRTLCIAAKT